LLSSWPWLCAATAAAAVVALTHATQAMAADGPAAQQSGVSTVLSGVAGTADRTLPELVPTPTSAAPADLARATTTVAPLTQAAAPVGKPELPVVPAVLGLPHSAAVAPAGALLPGGMLPAPVHAAVDRMTANADPASLAPASPDRSVEEPSLAPRPSDRRLSRGPAASGRDRASADLQRSPLGNAEPVPGAKLPAAPAPFPYLPGNPPVFGASTPFSGLGTSPLTWVAILTMLMALLASARARLGSAATIESGTFVSRMERPG
jgi:hypothetical protein